MEEQVKAFDWHRILIDNADWAFLLEVLMRTGLVLLLGFCIVRIMGKRGFRELTPFEYFLIIAMGSAAGDPMFHSDTPLLPAAAALLGMLGIHRLLVISSMWSKKIENVICGEETCIVKHGRILTEAIHVQNFSKNELLMQMRLHEIENLGEVRWRTLRPMAK